jgi:hypothetical protein
MRRAYFTAAVLVGLGAGAARADGPAAACTDTTAIRWFLPGEFAAARKEAEKSKRILLIKGIAFGVDEAGAASATKGCW